MRTFRFVHIGVAAALAAATATAIGIAPGAGAVGGSASTFVPIVPCRLADTRSGTDHVGVRATPLGTGEIVAFTVWGTNGNCTIPTSATGIATNVTIANPTSASYLTVYPADAPTKPTASNLNWIATSSPTPNQVTVALSATGVVNTFNNAGSVDVIIDIVGYYQPAAAGGGATGPAGPAGPAGPTGPAGSSPYISFAQITAAGGIIAPTRNVGFAVNFSTAPPAGVFCLSFLGSIAGFMAIATPEYGNDDTSPSNGRQTFVEVRATPASCVAAGYSATSTIEVDTGYQVRGSTVSLANDLVKANEPFFITIIGP